MLQLVELHLKKVWDALAQDLDTMRHKTQLDDSATRAALKALHADNTPETNRMVRMAWSGLKDLITTYIEAQKETCMPYMDLALRE